MGVLYMIEGSTRIGGIGISIAKMPLGMGSFSHGHDHNTDALPSTIKLPYALALLYPKVILYNQKASKIMRAVCTRSSAHLLCIFLRELVQSHTSYPPAHSRRQQRHEGSNMPT